MTKLNLGNNALLCKRKFSWTIANSSCKDSFDGFLCKLENRHHACIAILLKHENITMNSGIMNTVGKLYKVAVNKPNSKGSDG